MYQLSFRALHKYQSHTDVTVPVVLRSGSQSVRFPAKVDTGATFCIFKREHGEALGLDVEAGTHQRIATATGQFSTFGHSVILSVLDYDFDVVVYFAADSDFSRNVLGRLGWINQVRLGLVDHDGELYVSRYGE